MLIFSAIVAAVAPTLVYSMLIWWLDRYEKEPLGLVIAAFFWGAIPAIALAVLFELVLAVPIDQSPLGPGAADWGLAPLVEESLKALALAGLFIWARQEFDGPLDGIVYGALIGFGFSMTENALYFISLGDVAGLFWLRGVFFGLNHALFTSMVGLAFGAVRYQKSPVVLTLVVMAGLVLAIVFHAAHNILAASFQVTGLLFSWVVQSSGVLVVLAVAVLSWRNERRWMRDELGEEVRGGILSAADFVAVTSSAGRMQREMNALFDGGFTRFRQMRHLHHALTELAFCKSKQRLADRFQDCYAIERLRHEIVALREALDSPEGALA